MRQVSPRRARFPSPSFGLGVLAGVLLIPLILVQVYVWQAGLDLHVPQSSREWVKLCARGQEDIYCKALRSVLAREVTGPVVVLYPGVTGDRDLLATLIVWKGRHLTNSELEDLVRANTLTADDLKTGVLRSIDGQVHQVSCAAAGRGSCRIGSLEAYRHTHFRGVNAGAIYVPAGHVGPRPFLLPREPQRDPETNSDRPDAVVNLKLAAYLGERSLPVDVQLEHGLRLQSKVSLPSAVTGEGSGCSWLSSRLRRSNRGMQLSSVRASLQSQSRLEVNWQP